MKIFDFFIKDRHLIPEDDYYRKRLMVAIVFAMGSFSILFIILSFFGTFSSELNPVLFFVTLACLYIFKYLGNDLIPFLLVSICGTAITIVNISNTGMIYSYNNKWFFVILMFILVVRPKYIKYFLLVILVSQIYFYLGSGTNLVCDSYNSTRIEELIDNLVFYVLGFLVLNMLYSFLNSKNKRLDKSKELLTSRTEQLIQSNQELEKFAYIASHDLKSPLRNIISFTMLLEKELRSNTTEKQKEYLEFIKSGAQKLDTLVDDVLNFSKVSGNRIEHVGFVDCNKIVNDIKELLNESLNRKNASVIVENRLPKIKGQRTMILILFKNLIENAIKYNEAPAPQIRISYEPGIVSSEIKFTDNGIGIEHKFHHTIFDMFSRLHAESKYEGTGLGLSLCKKIVDNLDGDIALDSQPEEGTTFTVILDNKILSIV